MLSELLSASFCEATSAVTSSSQLSPVTGVLLELWLSQWASGASLGAEATMDDFVSPSWTAPACRYSRTATSIADEKQENLIVMMSG